MPDRHHFEEKPLNRHNSAMARRIAMKFGMMTHYFIKPSDRQKLINKQDGGRPMSGHVRGRYTHSDSAGDRSGTVRMQMEVHNGATW